jgi:hypothetical protein
LLVKDYWERAQRAAGIQVSPSLLIEETKIERLSRQRGITRQTLYRHVAPDGSLQEHGAKLLGCPA